MLDIIFKETGISDHQYNAELKGAFFRYLKSNEFDIEDVDNIKMYYLRYSDNLNSYFTELLYDEFPDRFTTITQCLNLLNCVIDTECNAVIWEGEELDPEHILSTRADITMNKVYNLNMRWVNDPVKELCDIWKFYDRRFTVDKLFGTLGVEFDSNIRYTEQLEHITNDCIFFVYNYFLKTYKTR